MWILLAAFIGGFFIGAFIFFVVGAAKGYVSAVRHLTTIGEAIFRNAAATQKPQAPVAVSSDSTRFN
jgi:hypothetical protein